ncbi:MAG: nicotinate-nucleotide--dimethylbenzimidazole phosphoribosyltransferase [Candidatus Omnitrophica bacterium]|nr:nicotinate-nucleotide--dimethylbenzimidazole phosphoribosyltransferase [Candidatus Omnitrophota bacterium]
MEKMEKIKKGVGELNKTVMEKTQKHLDNLTKPQGSLGRLEEIAKQVAGITEKEYPKIEKKTVFTLAGDHGIVEENVSAYPQEVTPQMVYNFLGGGAGINVISKYTGCKVIVVDIGVKEKIKSDSPNFKDKKINFGTKNFFKEDAMTKQEAIKSIETGIELVEDEIKNGLDIVGTGEMGIGNTTPSSAITAFVTGKSVKIVTGRGTGIDDTLLNNKIRVIKEGLKKRKPNSKDGIDILSKIGGFEIGGMTGIILAGAYFRIPIVIDGFISGAAALLAALIEPKVRDFIIASHYSVEPGHKIILDYLGLKPLFNLDMRLGEGTGAALGIGFVDVSLKILNEMATFESASVSKKI